MAQKQASGTEDYIQSISYFQQKIQKCFHYNMLTTHVPTLWKALPL